VIRSSMPIGWRACAATNSGLHGGRPLGFGLGTPRAPAQMRGDLGVPGRAVVALDLDGGAIGYAKGGRRLVERARAAVTDPLVIAGEASHP